MMIAKNLNKTFKIGFKKNQGILARIVNSFLGKESKKTFKVLESISFELKKGEVLGDRKSVV